MPTQHDPPWPPPASMLFPPPPPPRIFAVGFSAVAAILAASGWLIAASVSAGIAFLAGVIDLAVTTSESRRAVASYQRMFASMSPPATSTTPPSTEQRAGL